MIETNQKTNFNTFLTPDNPIQVLSTITNNQNAMEPCVW